MGLMSSFHCVGMCGPIAMALPVHKGSRFMQLAALFSYNTGRAATYALLGTLIGALSGALVWVGYLRYLSIAAGIFMLLYVLWPSKLDAYLHVPAFWQRMVGQVKAQMAGMLHRRSLSGWIALGMLNGLLPCGMVYLAVVSSVAMGSAFNGALYMFTFGMGTLPAMMAVGFFKQWFTPSLRSRFRRMTPVFMAIAGIWLVVRGLAIQLPTALPSNGSTTEIPVCHSSGSSR
ncbi:sulfite exporter TauE/SafE family protein [Arundinibacter roseus]|uniref:Sulfite exporter TauE/SafE family protein n=1 Tax=Arundinibacter roseus TaxID=2070510 RepID=A0A4R4K1R3_9BACT|nr:sulfite exporter TauE/SafE family protein [Arundinibacter roseus]